MTTAAEHTGPLTVEEHQAAKAARPVEPAPHTVEERLHSLLVKNVKGDPTHRPSHHDPLTRVGASHKYIPTPSLDPRNVELIPGVSTDHVGYVRVAIDAFGAIHDGLQKLSDAREAAKKNGAWTEANQVLIVAKEAEKLQDRATKAFDIASKRLAEGISAIDQQLSGPLVSKADNVLSQEIRNHVKNLPQEKRSAFISDAVKAKDLVTLQAVLGGKHYLSGISEEVQKHHTRAYRELTTPDLVVRLDVMRKAQELVDNRAGLIFLEVEKALGAKWDTVQKLRTMQSSAEQALLPINSVQP